MLVAVAVAQRIIEIMLLPRAQPIKSKLGPGGKVDFKVSLGVPRPDHHMVCLKLLGVEVKQLSVVPVGLN
jgi:hypothetical protein